ncbi:MAG: Unknown protein [uncultured Sulfurovum sp.]|uniref:Uncharacterized protein n=1 Tax=uncultured Sulfurovum sp. TaxID=269237 RepID=A0A6S6SKR8_9BACT|nr:MAG: Unknown protein [uncultured Sulfurovum sp.]
MQNVIRFFWQSVITLLVLSMVLHATTYEVKDATTEENVVYNDIGNDLVASYAKNKQGYVEWEIEVDQKTQYNIAVTYKSNTLTNKHLKVKIDSRRDRVVTISKNSQWAKSNEAFIFLKPGTHTIRLYTERYNSSLEIKNLLVTKSTKINYASYGEPNYEKPESSIYLESLYDDENLVIPKSISSSRSATPGLSMSSAKSAPVNIIIDTDMMTDCDDAAAIGMAHALEDKGEAKILGIALSAHDTTHYNGITVSAINRYYNSNDNIPISSWYGLKSSTNINEKNFRIDSQIMHKKVKDKHSDDGKLNYNRESSLDMYRRVLKKASDHSVKIVVIGTNFNIARLLKYEKALVNQKVSEIILGSSPDDNVNMCSRGKSAYAARVASDYVFNNTPNNTRLTAWTKSFGSFISNDYQVSHLMPWAGKGYNGTKTPMETTYLHAYNTSTSTIVKGRPVWDQVAIWYAVRGVTYNGKKYMDIHENGHFYPEFASNYRAVWKTNYNKSNHRQVGFNSNTRSMVPIIKQLMYQKPSGTTVKAAQITAPTYNSTVNAGSNVTVRWTNYGGDDRKYLKLYINNKYISSTYAYGTSTTMNIPSTASGIAKFYLYTYSNGKYVGQHYRTINVKKQTITVKAAQITAPTYNSTVNAGSNVTVRWTNDGGDDRKYLRLYIAGKITYQGYVTGTSQLIKIPSTVNGQAKLNLFTYNNGKYVGYHYRTFNVKKQTITVKAAQITAPTYNSTVNAGSNVTVRWTNDGGDDRKYLKLYIAGKITYQGYVTGTSKTIKIPSTSSGQARFYLYTYNKGKYVGQHYRTFNVKKTFKLAQVISPSYNSIVNAGQSITIRWEKYGGDSRNKIQIKVGSTWLVNKYVYGQTSYTVKTPSNLSGSMNIWLYSYNEGKYKGYDYHRLQVQKQASKLAEMTSPTGYYVSSSQIFRWNKGSAKAIRIFIWDNTANKKIISYHSIGTSARINLPRGHKITLTLETRTSWGGNVVGKKTYSYKVR